MKKEKEPNRSSAFVRDDRKAEAGDTQGTPTQKQKYFRLAVSRDYTVDPIYIFNALIDPLQISLPGTEFYFILLNQNPYLRNINEYMCPYLFFQVHYNQLRILGSNIVLDMGAFPSGELLQEINNAANLPFSFAEYQAIYTRLSMLQAYYTSYYKKLLQFKWEYCQISFPLFDRVACIRLENSWLVIDENNMILNQHFVYSELKKSLRYIIINETLFSELTNELYALRNERIVNTPLQRPFIDYHSEEHYRWPVDEAGGYMEYLPVDRCAVLNSAPIRAADAELSDSLRAYLHTMTDGEIEKLNIIAEFLARVFCLTIPSDFIWTVPSHYKTRIKFMSFLHALIGNSFNSTLFSMVNARNNDLICDYLNGVKVQMPIRKIKQKAIYNYRLSKFLSGKEFIFDDPFQRYHFVKYSPVILTQKTDEIFEGVPYYCKFKEIELSEHYAENPNNLTLYDTFWIKVYLVTYGMSLVLSSSTSDNAEGFDHICQEFIRRYCESDPEARTDTKVFYKFLSSYIEAIGFRGKVLPGSTTATAKIVGITNWTVKSDRRNKNRKAYFGIRLNTSRLEDDLTRIKAEQSFDAKLAEIQKMVVLPPIIRP